MNYLKHRFMEKRNILVKYQRPTEEGTKFCIGEVLEIKSVTVGSVTTQKSSIQTKTPVIERNDSIAFVAVIHELTTNTIQQVETGALEVVPEVDRESELI
jgi:hypothetical protein